MRLVNWLLQRASLTQKATAMALVQRRVFGQVVDDAILDLMEGR